MFDGARKKADEALSVAQTARDIGNRALAELGTHTGICSERQGAILRRLDSLEGLARWVMRGIIAVLLAIIAKGVADAVHVHIGLTQ